MDILHVRPKGEGYRDPLSPCERGEGQGEGDIESPRPRLGGEGQGEG